MFHHDPRHTGHSPFAGPATPALKWPPFSTGYTVQSSPSLAADGTIYIGSFNNNLYAMDSSNGTQQWVFHTDGGIYSSPAVATDGTIYVGSEDDNLYAINPDGTPQWAFLTGCQINSSPVIGSDGTIYVGSNDGHLYAINANGTEQWAVDTGWSVFSSPAIGGDGTIYVGSGNHDLYAITPDGTPLWAFTTWNAITSSPAIGADGTIYIGSYDNNLYAINPDGTSLWTFPTGNGVDSSPAIGADGTIYVGSEDHKLYAINPNGTLQWTFLTGGGIICSPAIGADGTIYVGSADGNLYAVNPSGTQLWAYFIGMYDYSSPAIGADGTIYIGSCDYHLYAIGPGEQRTASVIIANVTTITAPTVQVPVTLTALGDENTLGGTIAFDPAILGNPQLSPGSDDPSGAYSLANYSQTENGLVSFAVALPPGQTFAAGTQQVAVLTFDSLDPSFIGPTPVNFTDQPMSCELVDANADDLTATWQNGSVTIDHAPVAGNSSYTINENTTLTTTAATGVLANDSDVDGNTLTAVLITGPSYGTLTFNADGSFSYVPWLCFVGTDTFTYQAYDGMAYSNTATVTITVNATGYEGDVAPKPYGNGVVTLADWVQEGRYVAGLDTIPSYPNSIFMAADCSPLSTKGDGQLTVADWVQVGRFALGLDPLTPIGGPAQDPPAGSRTMSASRLIAGKTARALNIDNATLTRGKAGTVAVTLNALGDESALGFSVRFDPKCLKFVSAKVTGVAANATLNVNAKDAAQGNLGVALMLPLPITCKAGKGTVVEFTFLPLVAGATPLSFSDQVVTCEIAGATAAVLSANFVNSEALVRQ